MLLLSAGLARGSILTSGKCRYRIFRRTVDSGTHHSVSGEGEVERMNGVGEKPPPLHVVLY